MRKLLAMSFAFSGAFACLPFAAGAQPAPEPTPAELPPAIPVWSEIETVESTALPGPALWRISKGDSEVWILGMIGSVPKGISWNSDTLAEVMKDSRAVIVPPRAEISVGMVLSAGWLVITNCCSLFRLDRGKLDDLLPEETRLKLAVLRESVDGDAKLYQGDEPFGAGIRLNGDVTKKYNLQGDNPMPAVLKLANSQKLKLEPAGTIDPLPVIREGLKVKPQQQVPCLDPALQDAERRIRHARPMAEAWAVGDIKGLKAHFAESRELECIAATVHAMGAIQQNLVPSMVKAIAAALEKPGKTFAVVAIGPLLRKDGVLERLEAQGLVIEGPPE